MYYVFMITAKKKSDFFFVFSANCISKFYMYMLHVHILYTFICSYYAKKAHQRLKVYVRVTCSW